MGGNVGADQAVFVWWVGLSQQLAHLAFSVYTIEGRARILPPLGVSTTAERSTNEPERSASFVDAAGLAAGAGVLAMVGPAPVSVLVTAAVPTTGWLVCVSV